MLKKGLSIFLAVFLSAVAISATPLDDYVNTPDPHYKYELIYTYNDQVDYKIYILNMTSQKWKDETFVKNPIWWHYVAISVPNKVLRPDAAFMFIAGGSQESSIPNPNDKFVKLLGLFAASTGTIAVNLFQIPNQPTVFVDDPTQQRRTEDAVIAWTWKKFIENTNDPYVLLRLPMTKAAVRAMDAATEFTLKQGFADIKKWMIGGESKRGWTTWTTAAVDKRVFAAMPIVMDMLDFNTNLHKHFMSLGGWTFEFYDYYVVNITTKVDSPELFEMARVIDPKFYLDRYKNIKLLVINTAGDEFFFHDNTHSYWSDLVSATSGTALLRRIPNAEHALIGHTMSLFFSFRSFFLTNYERHENKKNAPQPLVRWLRSNNATHGVIQVIVDIEKGAKPSEVEVYYARTLEYDRRDFRLRVNTPGTNGSGDGIWHPVIWEKTKSIISKNETSSTIIYRAAFLKPLAGWLGFFFQLSFPSVEHSVNVVTTETNIIPESYPFPDCTLDSCYGTLV